MEEDKISDMEIKEKMKQLKAFRYLKTSLKYDSLEKGFNSTFQIFFEEIMAKYRDIYITEIDSRNDQEVTLNHKSLSNSMKRKKMREEESFCC